MNHIKFCMIGTTADERLLKKVLKAYLPRATAGERDNIECYLGLIDHAVAEAKKRQNAESQKERK